MVRVRVRLLGTVSVEIDGKPVDLAPGRATELLAWLAAHPGRHPRRRVASLFWPDVADTTARASLRTALWTLKKVLGPGGESVLVQDRNEVGLDGPGLWVDLRERDGWSIDEVLSADVDNVFPGIEAEWVDELRADHRAAMIARLASADERVEADGDIRTGLRIARRLAEIDPFSEEHHRLLLRRLATAGERAAAIQEHERFRRRLWDELGVRPSRATLDLVQRVSLGAERQLARLPARLARLAREPMVGRDDERDHLLSVWRECRAGDGARVVLVEGEAGIGKTRLLAELAAAIHAEGGRVLFGAAAEDELLPGEPFVEALGGNQGVDPQRLIEAARATIESSTADGPVALVLDDFHWADSASFAILRRLVRAPEAQGLMVLVAYRGEGESDAKLSALAADVARDAHVVRLPLPPLSLAATTLLLAGIDPGGRLLDRIERIHVESGGNPFFIRELGRYLMERPRASDIDSPVPETVRSLVVAKLQALSPLGGEAVSMAAVLGHRAELPVLRHMSSRADVLDGLEEAVAAGLMEEEDVGVHVFVHALMQSGVYEILSKSRRAELHRLAADALQAVHGDTEGLHLFDIAEHRCATTPPGSPIGATADALRASRWGIAHHAYDRAVVVLTKALRVCEPSARQELAVLRAIAYQRLTHEFIDPVSA